MKKSAVSNYLWLALFFVLTIAFLTLSIIFKGGIRVLFIILTVVAAFMAFMYAVVIIDDAKKEKEKKRALRKEAERMALIYQEKERINAEYKKITEAYKNGTEDKASLEKRRRFLQEELMKIRERERVEIERDNSAMCYSMSMTPPSGGNDSMLNAFSLIDRFDEHKYDDLIAEINAAHDEKTDNSTDA